MKNMKSDRKLYLQNYNEKFDIKYERNEVPISC